MSASQPLRVLKAEPLAPNEWRRFDERFPAPTFTARPAWSAAWCDAFPQYQPAPLRCRLSDGARVIVPALCARTSLLRLRAGEALPWNESIVIQNEENGALAQAAQAACALAHVARREYDSFRVTLWPQCDQAGVDLGGERHADETSIIDLSDGADAAIARMDGRSRRMAGQAVRRGVRPYKADAAGAVDAYYGILLQSAQRWGLNEPTIPKNLIEAVVRHGGSDVEIWLADCDGVAAAGGVVLFGSQEMYFWSAAMRAEYANARPSNALNVALLHAAANRGTRWYNMGSSSGLEGVQQFKDRLGAVRVPYVTQVIERRTFAAYRAIAARLRR